MFSQCLSPSLQTAFIGIGTRKVIPNDPYPKMKPTIDMTAAVRPYVRRLASQAVGSGNVSMNHSCKTGLKLLFKTFLDQLSLALKRGQLTVQEHPV